MVGEEARVLDLLLGPAKFEEVVWRIKPLLHLHVPFHHNAMEGPVDRPHTLHLLVQLQRSEHLAAKGGQIVVDKRVSVVVDVAERLLLLHEGCLRVATHKPHDDGAFLHRARFLQVVADTDVTFIDVDAHVACDGDHDVVGIFICRFRNAMQANVLPPTVLCEAVKLERLRLQGRPKVADFLGQAFVFGGYE